MCIEILYSLIVIIIIKYLLFAGALAYLGFAGYLNLGEDLWGRPLNYFLIPVAVSYTSLGLLIVNSSVLTPSRFTKNCCNTTHLVHSLQYIHLKPLFCSCWLFSRTS